MGLTKDIQMAVGKMQVLKNHLKVIENFKALNAYECDVFSIGSGGSFYEFEVKISRSDFLKPKEKIKHAEYRISFKSKKGEVILTNEETQYQSLVKVPNYFSYACPAGLIKASEIPSFAGLYYFEDGELTEERAPKRIHPDKFDSKAVVEKIVRTYSQRSFLGGTMMTYLNRQSKKLYEEGQAELAEMRKRNGVL